MSVTPLRRAELAALQSLFIVGMPEDPASLVGRDLIPGFLWPEFERTYASHAAGFLIGGFNTLVIL